MIVSFDNEVEVDIVFAAKCLVAAFLFGMGVAYASVMVVKLLL